MGAKDSDRCMAWKGAVGQVHNNFSSRRAPRNLLTGSPHWGFGGTEPRSYHLPKGLSVTSAGYRGPMNFMGEDKELCQPKRCSLRSFGKKLKGGGDER